MLDDSMKLPFLEMHEIVEGLSNRNLYPALRFVFFTCLLILTFVMSQKVLVEEFGVVIILLLFSLSNTNSYLTRLKSKNGSKFFIAGLTETGTH